jgi:dipeptidyl aminopeptidase/acylaminoacyl peptidase
MPPSIDALLSVPAMGAVLLAPDGRHVAWSWSRKAPATDIYVAPTDASAAPRRLTTTADDTALISWSADGAALVIAEDRGGDERLQLFRLALDGRMTALTEPSPPFFLRGGDLDPAGRFLVFAANLDPATGAAIEASLVIRQDLRSGARVALARPRAALNFRPLLNRAGTHILYARRDLDPSGTQIWLVDIEGREDREILSAGATVKTSASWFPDGRRALIIAETATHKRLGVLDTASGAVIWLIDDPARGIETAHVPENGDLIVVMEVLAARGRAFLLDPATRRETPIRLERGTLLPIGPLPDGAWLGRAYSATQPDDLVRFTPGPGAATRAAALARPLAGSDVHAEDLRAPEDFRWRSVDGREIQGWLYRPLGAAKGLVVQVHGGPTMHSEDAFNAYIQAMLGAGFAVLDPNYRGSTGFGLAFRLAIRRDGWGGIEQDDIRTGAEAVVAQGIVPPGKVAVSGTSYGGYSAWCAVTRWPPSLLAAAAPICGMTDLVLDYYSTRPDLRPYSEEMLGGSPETAPERYRTRSPIHFVANIKARLLIVQGMNDPNVTPDNLHAVEAALKSAGVPYETLLFDDEGHGIRKPRNQRVLYERLIDFFGRSFAQQDRS